MCAAAVGVRDELGSDRDGEGGGQVIAPARHPGCERTHSSCDALKLVVYWASRHRAETL